MTPPDLPPDLDLGHGHVLWFTAFAPDRTRKPHLADVPDLYPFGAIISHQSPDGRPCVGQVVFDSYQARIVDPTRPMWTVEETDPLTLSPSILCRCGDHGWVGAGRWQPAY